MHIPIEKGKTLIIRLLAVGSVDETRGMRDVWFEVNGEVSEYTKLMWPSIHFEFSLFR